VSKNFIQEAKLSLSRQDSRPRTASQQLDYLVISDCS